LDNPSPFDNHGQVEVLLLLMADFVAEVGDSGPWWLTGIS
jgi:hypothetical protein